jgi:hypothetical protein
MLCELPGLGAMTVEALDGTLPCPLIGLGASDVTDPEFEATLRRRRD